MLSPTAALEHKVDEVLHAQIRDIQSPLPEEVHRLVYELELRVSELEDQNEELRKTHQQLEAYRDRYIDLYDFAPLGYVTLDEDGYVQEINLAGAKLLGVERDELTGYSLDDYVCNDHKKVFGDHLGQCVGERREVTSELCLAARDGRSVSVQLHSVPIVGPNEEHFCKTAITDISQRTQAKTSLEQERNLLRTLIDNLPDCVYVKDAEGRFLAANLAVAQIMGAATPHDVLGKTDADFYPPELVAEYRADEERLLQAGEPLVNKDEPRLDSTGILRTVLTTKVPLKDSQGEVYGLVGISRDITENVQAEEMLRLTQFAVDHAADSIFWIGSDARIVYGNLNSCEHLGYSREELLALTIHDIDPNFPAEVWPAHWEHLKQVGTRTFESQHRAKDGRLIPVEITVDYLGFGGKEYHCAYVRDITARNQAYGASQK